MWAAKPAEFRRRNCDGYRKSYRRCPGLKATRRLLHAYLRHQGLSDVADDGTRCAALLDRVMANIASALDSGTLRPDR